MKKVELLAPAGSFEALQAAVQNGCDAVYLGGSMFGARAFAHNFDEEEIKQAIAYAHLYDVRVFVTMNTLIREDELEKCVRYAQFLYEHDADALIVQDLGLFSVLKEMFPDMELHASTQMHIHNSSGIELLKQAGAARVVLARETPIEDIAKYSKLGVALEVFVQGALCVSYSGQCLMSSITLNRSGNRGECAQNCRMQYDLEKTIDGTRKKIPAKGKYILSPKDLNTLAYIPQLIEAGISSFKIEGRMKRPAYVACMVSLYRKAIDAYVAGTTFHIDMAMQEEMEKVFHRGFSAGHVFHKKGSRLMNAIRPNHVGVEVGTVLNIRKGKILVKLSKALHQGDGIRILQDQEDTGFSLNRLYKQGMLVNHGDAGDIIELDKTMQVEIGNKIVKTSDVMQLKTLQDTYQGYKRRILLKAQFCMEEAKPAWLEVMDEQGHCLRSYSTQRVEVAKNIPLSKQRIDVQLKKSKDTPFDFYHITYQIQDGTTLSIKAINHLRREVLAKLEEVRKMRHPNRTAKTVCPNVSVHQHVLPRICVIVHTMDQYKACVQAGIRMIFVEGSTLYQQLQKEEHVYLSQPRVMKATYGNTLECIQEPGGLLADRKVFCDASLHLTNSYTAAFLYNHHAIATTFSLEYSLQECIHIANAFRNRYKEHGNFVYHVYGREELMLSEYCPINAIEMDNDKKNCHLCRGKATYALVDKKKHRYPIMGDEHCRMHLLNERPRNRIKEIPSALAQDIQHFLCVFTIEDQSTCNHILQNVKSFIERKC